MLKSYSFKLLLLLLGLIFIESHKLSVNEKQLQIIHNYTNPNEDPCKNYYAYACGNWSLYHTGGRYSEVTGLIDHKVNKRILGFLNGYTLTDDSDNIYNKVWTYFMSCKREKKRNLRKYLQNVKPSSHVDWPLLPKKPSDGNATKTKWPQDDFNWMITVGKLRKYGLKNALMEHLVLLDVENSTRYVIDLDKPNLENEPMGMTLFLRVQVYLMELGVVGKKVFKSTSQIIAFEKRLRKLLEIEDEYGVLEPTIDDLMSDLPQIPWRKYFEVIFDTDNIDDEYKIQIRNWEYFVQLADLIDDTEPEVICNYIMFKFIYYLSVDGTSSFDKVDCMVDLRSKMDLAVNYIYKENFYDKRAEENNQEVYRIFQLLRTSFEAKFMENHLDLNEDKRDFIINKLNHMRINIGNLPKDVNGTFVADYYRNAKLSLRNYYKNHLEMLKLRFEKEHAQLDDPVKDFDDFFFITDSDTGRSSTPFYLIQKNLITIPFGFLQTPMFHHNMHDIFKLSLFGFLLAHEISHGFDSTGIRYDFQGNIQEVGSNISDTTEFVNAMNCMENEQTENIDERIADIVAIRLSYDVVFGNNSQIKSPHFSGQSIKHLFFLNFAQFFCGNLAAGFVDHDSDNIRLQQTLLNFEPFAKEYQCQLGDVMHPELKCRLW